MGNKSPTSKANRNGPAQNSAHFSALRPASPPEVPVGRAEGEKKEVWRPCGILIFLLADGQAQTAKGVVDFTCHLQEHHI
ncbi:hypothetical protein AOLI_G00319250 [Acnodon oligacanthus]